MTTFAPALHLQNDNIHTKIKAQMIIKDPGSSVTHLLACFAQLQDYSHLFLSSLLWNNRFCCFNDCIYGKLILLYAASTTYHTFDISSNVNIVLKRLDHCMIPVLIAGSYTPVCLIVLHNIYGYVMFGIVWGIAILAIAFKLLWVTCPKWISSVLYIVMGWTCVMALPQIYSALAGAAFFWLLAGGIFYTVGGVIYAVKMPAFNEIILISEHMKSFMYLLWLGASVTSY